MPIVGRKAPFYACGTDGNENAIRRENPVVCRVVTQWFDSYAIVSLIKYFFLILMIKVQWRQIGGFEHQ